eukprot:gene7787-4460_t
MLCCRMDSVAPLGYNMKWDQKPQRRLPTYTYLYLNDGAAEANIVASVVTPIMTIAPRAVTRGSATGATNAWNMRD